MKIAILTQPLQTNYGGLLQAYALQAVLEMMGHDILVVDIPMPKNLCKEFRIIAGRFKQKYLLRKKNIDTVLISSPNNFEEKIIRKYIDQFIEIHIKTTERIFSVKKISMLKKYQFDAYVVGSDQVWRPKYSPGILTYYLDFLYDDIKTKRIAYAASFGTDVWEYDINLTTKCKKLAQKFDAISVREDSGVKFCNEKFGVKAIHVLDPTMLLEKKDYMKLINNNSVPQNTKTILAYILDKTTSKDAVVQRIANYLNLTINSVMPKKRYSKASRHNLEDCIMPPVTDWLRGFMDSDYVVTDSFHGTVFSIIFNKPFLVIENKVRGLARIMSLLKLFDLEDKIISPDVNLNIEMINSPINFKKVNLVLKKHQEIAFAFLKNSLNDCCQM